MKQLSLKDLKNIFFDDSISVLWLYGSRSLGNNDDNSDYDIALAFNQVSTSKHESLLKLQDIKSAWLKDSSLNENQLSIVDINHAPIPLAVNIIETGELLFCNDDFRYTRELNRIWGQWSDMLYYQSA